MTTELNKELLLRAYRMMRRIRDFEERVHVEFATGEIPGFVHLYAGEEASASGVILHLRKEDYVASTHRGHGHCIAKGMALPSMMAEIYGKKSGICGGKGGSRHVADLWRLQSRHHPGIAEPCFSFAITRYFCRRK